MSFTGVSLASTCSSSIVLSVLSWLSVTSKQKQPVRRSQGGNQEIIRRSPGDHQEITRWSPISPWFVGVESFSGVELLGARPAPELSCNKTSSTSHTSHLTPHISHLTSHTLHLIPHISHLIPHTLHLTPSFSHLDLYNLTPK